MRLSDFSALTFDCYGTLIDWETGIGAALAPWLERAGVRLERDQVLEAFAELESAQQVATPSLRYPELSAKCTAGSPSVLASRPTPGGRGRSAHRSGTGRRLPIRPRRSPISSSTTGW